MSGGTATPGPAGSGAPARGGPSLYVHVPFCESKCSYCDFYSVAHDGRREPEYIRALGREIDARAPASFAPPTVFIGGGTPSALADADFADLLELVRSRTRPTPDVEWTVECNPGTLTRRKAEAMRAAGVTRVSIGVQSFDDRVLRSVGRVHDSRQARDAVETARAAGLPAVSIDLLFAIPGQGMRTFERDLELAVALGTDHVSAYALLYEHGTTLTRRREEGRIAPEDEGTELEMLHRAHEQLANAGFRRYEISNFARPGRECRHNLVYWRNGEYLGVGASAASYLGGVRRSNVASWIEWQAAILAGGEAVASSERLTPRRAMGEEVMLRLRLEEGMSLAELSRRWGIDAAAAYRSELTRFEGLGLLVRTGDGDRVTLTPAGIDVADRVLAEFI